MKNHPM